MYPAAGEPRPARPVGPAVSRRILLTGASGFIGSALVDALARAGHSLVLGVRDVDVAARRWPEHERIQIDFSSDHDPVAWLPRLRGIDVVINAVGLLDESAGQTFEAVHVRAPVALFEACVASGVERVIQISALGADDQAGSAYHLSKREADRRLAALPLRATSVQPSLVFAPHGTSARWFAMLASLPWIPLPGAGGQCLQPIHRDDLCAAITALVDMPAPPARLAAVGPAPLTLRGYLAALRGLLGLGRARFLPMPAPLVRVAATVGSLLPGVLLDRATLGMLERGNCADPGPITDVLGEPPRPVERFLAPDEVAPMRRAARLGWLLPLLRGSIALVWIVTGLVSLGLYPVADSLALLARTGLSGTPAWISLYGAALLDLGLGVATLTLARRRLLYRLQAALVLGYTAIITVWLPEFWLHPYGPVLKNLPLLAALWLLHELEE